MRMIDRIGGRLSEWREESLFSVLRVREKPRLGEWLRNNLRILIMISMLICQVYKTVRIPLMNGRWIVLTYDFNDENG